MATSTLTLQPTVARTDVAARLPIVFAVSSLVFQAASIVLKSELDPSWRFMSEYALGSFGWLMTMAFLLWGGAIAAVFITLRPHVHTRAGRIGLGCLLIGAAGPLLSGIFPMDAAATSYETTSTTGMLHNLGAGLADGLLIGAALVTWSLVRNNLLSPSSKRSLIGATLLAWFSTFLVMVSVSVLLSQTGGQPGPEAPVGWQGRFMGAAYLAWVCVAAVVTRSGERGAGRPVGRAR